MRAGTVASASFGLYRYKGLERQVANNDLAWAAAPSVEPNGKHTVYGFQLDINANSPRKDAAWEFVKHMTSPAAQMLAARGGEVVARASVYNDPYFASPEAADQQGWKQLVQQRGRMVTYSVIQSTFNQIAGEAFQRMILRNATPESVVTEVKNSLRRSSRQGLISKQASRSVMERDVLLTRCSPCDAMATFCHLSERSSAKSARQIYRRHVKNPVSRSHI